MVEQLYALVAELRADKAVLAGQVVALEADKAELAAGRRTGSTKR